MREKLNELREMIGNTINIYDSILVKILDLLEDMINHIEVPVSGIVTPSDTPTIWVAEWYADSEYNYRIFRYYDDALKFVGNQLSPSKTKLSVYAPDSNPSIFKKMWTLTINNANEIPTIFENYKKIYDQKDFAPISGEEPLCVYVRKGFSASESPVIYLNLDDVLEDMLKRDNSLDFFISHYDTYSKRALYTFSLGRRPDITVVDLKNTSSRRMKEISERIIRLNNKDYA